MQNTKFDEIDCESQIFNGKPVIYEKSDSLSNIDHVYSVVAKRSKYKNVDSFTSFLH